MSHAPVPLDTPGIVSGRAEERPEQDGTAPGVGHRDVSWGKLPSVERSLARK